MKYFISLGLVIILFLISCCDIDTQKSSNERVRVTCPNCDGYGETKARVSDKVVLGVVTFGMGLMLDYVQCDFCGGRGYVYKYLGDE